MADDRVAGDRVTDDGTPDDRAAEIARCREDLGRGAALFGADHGGVPGQTWYSLSGLPHLDYNLAAVYGGDVHAHAAASVDRIVDGGAPGMVMLAGPGLGAAQELADRDWVVAGALPFFRSRGVPSPPADGERSGTVRHGRVEDIAAARRIVARAYSMDEEVAAHVYSEDVIARPDVGFTVADVDGRVAAVALTHQPGRLATAWAVATDPDQRRHGVAFELVAHLIASADERRPGGVVGGVSTPVAERLYRAVGGECLEYWQVWTRPRWLLGSR